MLSSENAILVNSTTISIENLQALKRKSIPNASGLICTA